MKKIIIAFIGLFLCICHLSAKDSLQFGFQNPPASAKARTWWHWIDGNISKKGITADLEAMKRVGIQEAQIFNVGQGYPQGSALYLGDEWLDLFQFAVKEAERLGLEIGFHNGPGWSSSGGPWVTPKNAMQTIVFSETKCKGGSRFQGELQQPATKFNYYKDIAILAFPTPKDGTRIDDLEMKILSGHSFKNHLYPDVKEIPASALTRTSDIINLTTKMSTDGTLKWEVPAGEWTILRIGHTPIGVENRPAMPEGQGLECDKLNRTAVYEYWKGGIEPILEKVGSLVGSSLTNCLIDSYEVGCANWTSGFEKEFEKRRGYDCMSYMLTLAGYYVESGEISERFLWDFRRTIGDMMADNYYGYFSELCHQRGMKFSVEPYGGPYENMQVGISGDVPMCEFWLGNKVFLDAPKMTASIAHLNGTALVGAEAFTSMGGWLTHPAKLKQLGDWAWTEGVNRFIFHTYAHQPWDIAPGMTFHMYGTEMSRLNTWWEPGRAYMDYLARSQFLLQQGRFVADVLIFTGESSPNDGIYRPDIKALGYDYDEIGMDKMMSLTVKNGLICTPVGGSYHLLVLPETTWMSPQLAQKITELANAGAMIIGTKPMKSPSLNRFPKCDAEVQQLTNNIWDDGLIQHRTVKDALANIALSPDFSGGNSGADLLFIHREVNDADIYFVANPRNENRNDTCQFRIVGKQPELWNPETGEIMPIATWQSDKGSTKIPLSFESEGAYFIVFRKPITNTADPIVESYTKLAKTKVKPLPGLNIIKAEYGNFLPNGLADVTTELINRMRDGKLHTHADNSLAPSDPAPGAVKELRVEYTVGGQHHKASVLEFQEMTIPRANERGDVQITKAIYGKFSQGSDDFLPIVDVVDVTTKIASIIASETYIIPISNRLIDGDQLVNDQNKELRLTYSIEGENHEAIVLQGRELNLSQRVPEPKIVIKNDEPTWVTPVAGSITATTALGITKRAIVKTIPNTIELTGTWDVSFPPNLGAPSEAVFEKLISWTNSSDEGVRYFSGTASYHKRFSLTKDLVASGRSLELDLGRVRVMAEVILNGKNLGILWKTPFRIDLKDAVKAGENELEIRVTNLWVNRLIGDAHYPEDCEWGDWLPKTWPDWLTDTNKRSSERITFTTWKHWSKDSALQPSGLLGPVVLRPYVHVKLAE